MHGQIRNTDNLAFHRSFAVSDVVLSLSGIFSLDWNLCLVLGIFGDIKKNMKMCKMTYLSFFWKSYLILFSTFIIVLRFYAAPLVQEAGQEGVQNAYPRFLIWSKLGENPGKIRGNLCKISENLHKCPENLSKHLTISAKLTPKLP